MARRQRIDYPGAWHHVMNRGAAKQRIFLDNRDRASFITLLAQSVRRYGLEIHAYCLLDNHFHLLARTPEKQLSTTMQFLMAHHTQKFNKRHERDGPLFRGRFHSIVVDSDRYLQQVSRYIHRNPIGAGLSSEARLDRFPWSSYGAYVGSALRPTWLTRGVVLRPLGPRGYRSYVESDGTSDSFDAFYEKALRSTAVVLGDAAFAARLLDQHSIGLPDSAIRSQSMVERLGLDAA